MLNVERLEQKIKKRSPVLVHLVRKLACARVSLGGDTKTSKKTKKKTQHDQIINI